MNTKNTWRGVTRASLGLTRVNVGSGQGTINTPIELLHSLTLISLSKHSQSIQEPFLLVSLCSRSSLEVRLSFQTLLYFVLSSFLQNVHIRVFGKLFIDFCMCCVFKNVVRGLLDRGFGSLDSPRNNLDSWESRIFLK